MSNTSFAWVLEVRPGYEEEYKKRHEEIWPEMVEMLQQSGVKNYSIFRHGLTLFGYFETEDNRWFEFDLFVANDCRVDTFFGIPKCDFFAYFRSMIIHE